MNDLWRLNDTITNFFLVTLNIVLFVFEDDRILCGSLIYMDAKSSSNHPPSSPPQKEKLLNIERCQTPC